MTDLFDQDSHPLPGEDGEYEELRPELTRPRKLAVVALGVLIALGLLAGTVAFWGYRQLHPSGKPGAEVIVEIPTGSSTSAIADLLAEKDVIANALVFKMWLKFAKGDPSFKAGRYKLRIGSDADDVLTVLRGGALPPPSKRFTVPPGLNIRQVPAKIVSDLPSFSTDTLAQLIAATQVRSQLQPADKGLEGFLFPDTYEVGEGADEKATLQLMVSQFDKVATEIGLPDAQAKVGYDPYQVLIVASLVEKEAKVDADRAKIARVIYNRLAAGTPLGVDATLCYLKDEVPCVLRASDLAKPGPYNSRITAGLPPTPIASPGRASLEAALNPDDGDWIYYVLDPQLPAGQHLFTASASEFEAAKARCKAAGLGCD